VNFNQTTLSLWIKGFGLGLGCTLLGTPMDMDQGSGADR